MHKSSCPTLCFIMLKISETACCGSGAPLSANFHPANQLRQLHCNHSAFDQLAYAQTAALLCLGLLWLPTGCDRSTQLRVTTLETMWNSLTIPWRFAALLPMLSVTHIMPVLVLVSVVEVGMQQCMIRNQMKCTNSVKSRMDANMQLTMNSFRPHFPWQDFFHDTSLTFTKIPDISLTAVKFPDISRFSRQLVSLTAVSGRLWCRRPPPTSCLY